MNKLVSYLLSLIACGSLSMGFLYLLLNSHSGDNNIAFGKGTLSKKEKENGLLTTYNFKLSDLDSAGLVFNDSSITVLWIGNSQQHAINQKKIEDHISAFWLKKSLGPMYNVLGISEPNINFMEMSIIARSVIFCKKVDVLIISAVFDDLREGEIRADIQNGLYKKNEDLFTGTEIKKIIDSRNNAEKISGDPQKAVNLTTQNITEKYIEKKLKLIWPLWAKRGTILSNLYIVYYKTRNKVLKINPSTLRKVLPANFQNNSVGLKEMIEYVRSKGVRVILYIAPIRHNFPLPYEIQKYEQWKKDIQKLGKKPGIAVYNLEKLVPDQYWGLMEGEDIDFMHFKVEGHVLLGQKIAELIKNQ